jgi:hypothetical protein
MRILMLVVLFSVAYAQTVKLELDGKAQILRADQSAQNYSRSGGIALNLNLGAGDRLCVTEGKGRLLYGVKSFNLSTPGSACFEVAKPKGLWQNLVASCQDVGVCKKEAQQAFTREAKSRSLEGIIPILLMPADYSLSTLTLNIAGGKTARLLQDQTELAKLEADGSFALPSQTLQKTTSIEVLNASGVVVYKAPLRWVTVAGDAVPATPKEAALYMMTLENLSYAPAAYSYLLAAGETELASVLEAQIRAEFRGQGR